MLATQYKLFGGSIQTGDVVAKVKHLLETMPETRDSYAELVGRYWLEFDGLADILPPWCHDAFLCWLNRKETTSWKTIQNRAGEIQNEHPELDASPAVRELRRRRATQGPVR